MVFDKNLTAGLATGIAVGLGATLTLAEGLERANLDTSFMFSEGTVAEFGMGRVTPSLPATRAAFGLDSDSVAKSFTVSTFSTKIPSATFDILGASGISIFVLSVFCIGWTLVILSFLSKNLIIFLLDINQEQEIKMIN